MKEQYIKKILTLTNRNTSEAFDVLVEKSEAYLAKYLKVVEKLSK